VLLFHGKIESEDETIDGTPILAIATSYDDAAYQAATVLHGDAVVRIYDEPLRTRLPAELGLTDDPDFTVPIDIEIGRSVFLRIKETWRLIQADVS
jgi:hypothetical protein